MRYGIIALIVGVVAAYVGSVALYANSGGHHLAETPAGGDRSTATLVIEDIQSNYSVLAANLSISPGSALLDPQTQHLNQDLSLRVRSVATPTRRTWTKGMLPGVFPVPLTIAGEIENWPFDHYGSGPVEIELMHGPGDVPERVPVTFVNHLSGWQVSADGTDPYRVTVHRSLSAAAFGIVILRRAHRHRRPGPFRCRSDGARPTEVSATDDDVVRGDALRGGTAAERASGLAALRRLDRHHASCLWVLVVLVISMLLYIACWWRHLRPEVAVPANPAPSTP